MKKLLALVLALVMSMSLVTISNAAFKDADKIDHTEAVEVMSALGVINGMPDGSFAPAGNVTRAEMAKMITIIMLGDIDADAFKGTVTDLTDINGHWAEGFIKYCYSQGVIAGRGDSTFAPNANVTAVEAAKMLLVALGYNADVQGYVGSDWSINVIRDAQISKFFDDLSVTSTKVLTRDEAAQMIYNAVNAKTIEKSSSVDRLTGKVTDIYAAGKQDLLEKTFDVKKAEGKLDYDPDDYNSDKKEYTYDVGTESFKSKNDYTGLYMQNVEVLYKVDGTKTTVYGIYAKDSSVIATGVIGDITAPAAADTKVKIDGTSYKLTGEAKDVDIYAALAGDTSKDLDEVASYISSSKIENAYKFALIDNTGDGKGDIVVVYPFTVAKVTYVGSKTFTAGSSFKFEDVDVYTGIAKNDYVKITAAANTATKTALFEEVEEVSAKATAVKKTDNQINFGGNWFDTTITTAKSQTATAGSNCKYVAVNGYLFNLESDSSALGTADYVVVTKAADKTAGMDKTVTAQILKSDGTKTTIEVKKIGSDEVSGTVLPTVGSLYTYKVNDDGYYELTAATASADGSGTDFDKTMTSGAAYKSATSKDKGYVEASGTKYFISDDAVVFVQDGTKYSVTTGAKLKATNSDIAAGNVKFVAVKAESSTGYSYVKLAYVATGTLGETTDKYAYVTGDVVLYQDANDDNKYYVEIPVGDTTLTTKATTRTSGDVVSKAYALKKGDIIKYALNSDEKVDSVDKYTADVLNNDKATATSGDIDFYAAVTAYEAGNNSIRFGNTLMESTTTVNGGTTTYEAKMTDDTVVIYVDNDKNTIVDGGEIRVADSEKVSGTTGYYANVKAVVDAAKKEVKLLVVDVNNDILNIQK